MCWIVLWHILFYLISTALLFTRLKDLWTLHPHPPAHKQGFTTQVRDLNLEVHDHNADNESRFAGAFSTDAANRSDWLPAWGMTCWTRSTVSDSQPLRSTVFFRWDVSVISPKQLKNVCHFFVFGCFYYCIEVWKKVAILEWCQAENK